MLDIPNSAGIKKLPVELKKQNKNNLDTGILIYGAFSHDVTAAILLF